MLRRCLHSLAEAGENCAPSYQTEIIVVDSASVDGSPQMVRDEFPQVRLLASDDNLGYAKGNNLGVAVARGRYLLLLNPDTVVQPTALTVMLTYLDSQPTVGALGPQLLWPTGTIQSSRRRFPSLGSLFAESTLLSQWFPDNRYARRYHLTDIPPDRPQVVDWVVGAAIMIRSSTWQQVGLLDHNFFMYFEETDWCRRCVAAGWAIHYLPSARIIHYEGQSSEQVIAARTIRFQRSKIYYTGKYFGRTWATNLRLFLWLTFALQFIEEAAKWLLRHRPDLRRTRLAAYSQVLRHLMTFSVPQP